MHYYNAIYSALQTLQRLKLKVWLDLDNSDVPIPSRVRDPLHDTLCSAHDHLTRALEMAHAIGTSAPHLGIPEVEPSIDAAVIQETRELMKADDAAF